MSEPRPSNLRRLAEFWDIPLTDLRPEPEINRSELIDRLDRIEGKLDELLGGEQGPGGEIVAFGGEAA